MVDKNSMKISSFYSNRDIFITGGLGFLGKVLIEKLLRSCPELNRIFVLIRGKRDKTPSQRMKMVLNSKLFDGIKNENSSLLKKLTPIIGDLSSDNLGISNEDFEKLKNVSIIFHSAATVKFNETMKQVIITNVKGTLEIMKLSQRLDNLKAIVHVSTTYCHLDRDVLEEKIYPAYACWKKVLRQALKSDDVSLNKLLEKFKKYKHNTYTMSKHFAEQVCNEFRENLPIVIFRPAIVVPSVSDPMPGWIDNFYGPMGISVGVGTGLIKTIHAEPKLEAQWTAVDISAKVMILAAYKRANECKRINECVVYNCSTPVEIEKIVKTGIKYLKQYPIENLYWVPDAGIINSTKLYLLRFFIFQLLPAIFFDAILMIARKKPFLMRLQKNIYHGNEAIYNFASSKWIFKNDRTMALENEVSVKEMENFSFTDDTNPDLDRYMKNAILGAKQFLLKESIKNNSSSLKKLKIMVLIDGFLKAAFLIWVIYTLMKALAPYL